MIHRMTAFARQEIKADWRTWNINSGLFLYFLLSFVSFVE